MITIQRRILQILHIDTESLNLFFDSFRMPWRSDAVMEFRYSKLSISRVGSEGLSRAAQNHARQPRPTTTPDNHVPRHWETHSW